MVVHCQSISTSSTTIVYPDDQNLYYTGRVDKQDSNVYVFDWSFVTINFIVTGTLSIKASFSTSNTVNPNLFNVVVNDQLLDIPITINSTNIQVITLLDDLDPQSSYNVSISKRTEAAMGIVSFYGLEVDSTAQFTPLQPSSRKIEFIGDSITCGYGILGLGPCSFTPETEDSYVTYEGLISRALGAELYVESWSGKGMVRNVGDKNTTSQYPFPYYYNFTVANNASTIWTYEGFQPDAVVINLGTNDYSTQPAPPQSIFTQGYLAFIQLLKSKYTNNPTFFLACGPMISNPCCQYVKDIATQTGSTFINLQGLLTPESTGCAGHPNQLGHTYMAKVAFPIIQQTMDW
ncbi:esterase [Cavenderia fasciculata]|uniref:Esterase n=1 Tax=Cavenderia fasciculata TaxID=261658 RepID=F4Q3Y4_CACFS|nr:esterase [Cavenderia fasciculata]EGG17740.1 esterase [Cavenderia fasciculata]|eukprot:XP_004356224.1 esterase [Cavenderia fasciculata]